MHICPKIPLLERKASSIYRKKSIFSNEIKCIFVVDKKCVVMLGRLKKMLGIDGLRVDLITSETYDIEKGYVDGELSLLAKYDVEIEYIEIRIIEIYTRGRFGNKKTDEYQIGTIRTGFGVNLGANRILPVPFKVPVDYLFSSVDKFGMLNIFTRGLAKGAKLLRGVRSKYRMETEVKIDGSNIKVFNSKPLMIV